jgi:hypothetical protein
MNAHCAHALVLERQAELYHDAEVRRSAPEADPDGGMRRRIGMLLVEVGLHLLTGSGRPAFNSQIVR